MPSIEIDPDIGESNPKIIFKNVVLPDPVSPISPMNSPFNNLKLRLLIFFFYFFHKKFIFLKFISSKSVIKFSEFFVIFIRNNFRFTKHCFYCRGAKFKILIRDYYFGNRWH